MSINGGTDLDSLIPKCTWCNWYLQDVQRTADKDGQLLKKKKTAFFVWAPNIHHISAQENQKSSKKNHMKAEDESPTQRRNCKNDNDDEAERMEDIGSKGGGRLKHCIVDGDVPLCLRRKLRDSKEASSSVRKRYEEKENRSSTQSKTKHCVMNKTASGSKDMCPRSTEEKDQHSKNKEVTFIILQKT